MYESLNKKLMIGFTIAAFCVGVDDIVSSLVHYAPACRMHNRCMIHTRSADSKISRYCDFTIYSTVPSPLP